MFEYSLLAIAGFLAGVVNTIAGGGTFLTFPALIAVGAPPVAANATSTVAVTPGYLGGALGFLNEIRQLSMRTRVRLTVIALSGGLVGSVLLLASSNDVFAVVVPFLLFFATSAFLNGERLRVWAMQRKAGAAPEGAIGLFAVSLYGGYFNGGLGIVLLALFALWGWRELNRMNAVKNMLSFALSGVSVAIFAMGGLVLWPQALWMMGFAVFGGYSGARLARWLPASAVRFAIGVIGYGMSAIFLYRLF